MLPSAPRTTLLLVATLLTAAVLVVPVGAEEATPSVEEQVAAIVSDLRDADPERRARAAHAAAGLQHASLLTPLLRLLADKELGVRLAATKALATREGKTPRRRAAAALAPRIARLSRPGGDEEELLAVIEALGTLAQRSTIKPLLDGIKLDADIEVVRARMMAVAEVPHAEAVERLIQFLDRGRRGGAGAQQEAARKALMYATGVRQNRNPDQWRAWWREVRDDFDFEAVAAARAQAAAEAEAKAQRAAERKAERERKRRERREKREREGGKGDGSDGRVAD